MTLAHITGTGSALPERIVTNKELEPLLQTTDEWIAQKIGIQERRFVSPGTGPSDLAVTASLKALEQANKKPQDVDAIIMATSTPDYCAPGAGVLLQQKLGCHRIPAFDIHNTSPGFLFALELANSLICSGRYSCLLVVGAEVHSSALDLTPRGRMMSVIFGDGAGAIVLEPGTQSSGIIATKLHSDGSHYDKLWCEAPASVYQPRITPQMALDGKTAPTMDGRYVFEHAVKFMGIACEELLAEQQVSPDDLDWVVPHQANLRIIEALALKLGVSLSKVGITIHKYGNTSAASIPITLDELVRTHKIKPHQKILLTSFGSGFSWGSALIRW